MGRERGISFPAALGCLALIVASFYIGGPWLGVPVWLIITVIIGWPNRHDGPLPTNRPSDAIEPTVGASGPPTTTMGECVLFLAQRPSESETRTAILQCNAQLSPEIIRHVDDMMNEILKSARRPGFWSAPFGQTTDEIKVIVKVWFEQVEVEISEAQSSAIFSYVMLTFVLSYYRDEQIREAIKKSVA